MPTNYNRRPITPQDAWLTNTTTGKVVGVELADARTQKTYIPSSATEGTIDGALVVAGAESTTSDVGAANGATVSASELGDGVLHKTVLTLTATPITVRDTEQGGGVKIYDFPLGKITILGATGTIVPTTTSVLANTLNASKTGNWGVGTATQANATLVTTEQDILHNAAFVSSATINVAGTATAAVGGEATYDGSVTAKDAYLNLAVATATDIDGDATVTVTGTITILWVNDVSRNSVDATTVRAGISGTAGTVEVFPSTAAKGKTTFTMSDNTGDTTTNINVALQAAARTLTVPDPGASASFMMTEGAQTINGVQTTTLPRVADHNTTITAFAGGGQASAVALTGEFNNVTTVATAGDSVKLLTAVLGQVQTVKNSGAAALAVFPFSGDSINAMAADLSVDIPVDGQLTFRAISATVWETEEMLVSQAPSTQKGSLVVKAADSAGNTVTTVTNASQAAARTYTIPDAGTTNASFVMTEGAQTINGAKTLGATLLTSSEVGTKNGATVTVAEAGDGALHRSVFTLTATPVTLADDAGVGSWAALKLYDFPAGNIVTLGASINTTLTLNETWWVDNITGSVGLGTVSSTDASTIGTTRQNIVTVANIAALVAQVGPVTAQSTVVLVSGVAAGTDADVVLNVKLADDALHFPDLVTNGAFTGNSTGWTETAGWAYGTDNEAATLTNTALTQTPASPTIVAGVSYKLVFDATQSAGSVTASVGGTAGTARSTSATFTETIVAGANGVLAFTGTGFSGTIDNVVLTPLTGSGTVTGTVTVVWTNAGDF